MIVAFGHDPVRWTEAGHSTSRCTAPLKVSDIQSSPAVFLILAYAMQLHRSADWQTCRSVSGDATSRVNAASRLVIALKENISSCVGPA